MGNTKMGMPVGMKKGSTMTSAEAAAGRPTDVGSEEVASAPVAVEEDRPSREEDDDDARDDAEPGDVGLANAGEVELPAVNSLYLAGLVETDEGVGECSPCNKSSDGREVEQPLEGLSSSARTEGEVGEEGKEGGESNSVDGDSAFVDAREDLGCLTIQRHAEEGPEKTKSVSFTAVRCLILGASCSAPEEQKTCSGLTLKRCRDRSCRQTMRK